MSSIDELVLASGNPGKLRELRAMLEPRGIRVHPQSEFRVDEVAETGLSFVENAIIKARHAARATGLPALGDDSGLAVAALDGAPGIYSSRYAGAKASDADNVEKLLTALRDRPPAERQARFHCLLVLMHYPSDPTPTICEGTWEGWIQEQPSGERGFGYDPVFHVPSHGVSAAQLDPDTKNRLSHRGQALAELLRRLS